MEVEEWRSIVGYENIYEISNKGNVRSLNRYSSINRLIKGKVLKPFLSNSGYYWVNLCKNGKVHNKFIHRLVGLSFIDNLENKSDINHIDGNKLNNHVLNLEWLTHSENMQYSYTVLNRPGVNKGKFGKNNKNSIKVKQLDLEGNLVRIWDCIMDYERISGKRASDISAVLYGKQKTAHGYKWEKVKRG